MRIIKFRGKVLHHNPMTNPDDGWVTGFYYEDLVGGEMKPFIKGGEMVWEVIPETVGQFTGLQDKNGKDIYEGDIVLFGKTITQKVEFFAGAFGYRPLDNSFIPYAGNSNFTFNPFCKDNEHEVIGNIHDNLELLKGGL